jgi:hypothetical protein
MKLQFLPVWCLSAGLSLFSLATVQPVRAASLTALATGATSNVFKECINDGTALVYDENRVNDRGWLYSFDSPLDGVAGTQVGGNGYEIYGSAIKETEDSIWVVLNSNMPLTGLDGTAAEDGNIGWGDWFLNLSGQDFTTASNSGNLFGVRFAGTNDSLAPSIGLYSNVTATSVTGVNDGFSTLTDYENRVLTYGCPDGSCLNYGDLSIDTTYFDRTQSLNAIGSGTYLSEITYLTLQELQDGGYDSSQFAGSQTVAFKFDKSTLCAAGAPCQSVPESSSVLGLVVVGILGLRSILRRNQQPNSLCA